MTSSPPLRFHPFRPEDHGTFLRLFADLGVDDPPPDLDRYLALASGSFFARDESGAVVGYTHYEPLETDGYVRHVVVDPAARGRGVGRALMEEVARRLRAAGCTRWRLNVKPDNLAARRLYEGCGMREAHRTRVVRTRWTQIDGLADPSPTDRPAIEIAPAAQAEHEAALGVPRKLLANLAGRGFVPLGVADAAGSPIGVAAFDPRFPGAFPFRATTLAAARALLDAARARRVEIDDPARPWRREGVQVVVEDGDRVADALVRTGGDEVLVTLHYAGPL